jgi:hypothetical protein
MDEREATKPYPISIPITFVQANAADASAGRKDQQTTVPVTVVPQDPPEATKATDMWVWVRRQWHDSRKARYRFRDIEWPHWDTVSGGIEATTPQPFIHGYVWCDQLLEGELAHSCGHGPHRIKICIVKKDNPTTFALVLEQAGPKPPKPSKPDKRTFALVGGRMGFPQRLDDEAFFKLLDEAQQEWIAEAEAQRQMQQQIGADREPDRPGPVVPVIPDEPSTTADELMRLDALRQFWQRPDVRLLLKQHKREARALRPGDRVYFRQFLAGTGGYDFRSPNIPAVVMHVNPRTIRIRLWLARDGSPVECNVTTEHLTRRTEMVSIFAQPR